jgi:hypothetical protein
MDLFWLSAPSAFWSLRSSTADNNARKPRRWSMQLFMPQLSRHMCLESSVAAPFFTHSLSDTDFSIFRPRIYLSVFLGWLSLVLYLPTFLNQADRRNPRAWIPVPDLNKLAFLLVPSGVPASFAYHFDRRRNFRDPICVQDT